MSRWIEHVKDYSRKHNIPYSQALKQAKDTYQKNSQNYLQGAGSNIYCGCREVPKGKTRGSMKECADCGQIRYYGLKKTDPLIIMAKSNKNKLNVKKRKQALTLKYVALAGKIKRVKSDINSTNDQEKIKNLKQNITLLETQLIKIKNDLSNFN